MSSTSVLSWVTQSFWDEATMPMFPELAENAPDVNFKPFLPELQALDEAWDDELVSASAVEPNTAAPITSSTLDAFAQEYLEAYFEDLSEESHPEDELPPPVEPPVM